MEGNYWCKRNEEMRVIPNRSAASQLSWLVRFVVHLLVPLVEYFRSFSLLLQDHLFISWYAEKRFASCRIIFSKVTSTNSGKGFLPWTIENWVAQACWSRRYVWEQ